jgi:glycyl-tRNA synthetase beta chain
LKGSLREQGFSAQEVDAVLALRSDWALVRTRCTWRPCAFAALPQSAGAGGRQQAHRQHSEEGDPVDPACQRQHLLLRTGRTGLHQRRCGIVPQAKAQFDAKRLHRVAADAGRLRAPVDAFFDEVMVNTPRRWTCG